VKAQKETIFWYRAKLGDTRISQGKIIYRIDIPELISGLHLEVDTAKQEYECAWYAPRGYNELEVMQGEGSMIFPDSVGRHEIVLVGFDRPRYFINAGKWYFQDVKFYGFIRYEDPVRE
jgi:hypothetical protein